MESLGHILRRVTLRRTSEGGVGLPEEDAGAESASPCRVCNGRGWVVNAVPVGHPDFGQAVPCRCTLETTDEERLERFQKFSNLGSLVRFTFDALENLDGTPEAQAERQRVIEAAREYAASPRGWFVIGGASGTGKTPIAAAIVNAYLETGRPAYFMTVPDLLDHLRATFGPNSEVAYDELFEQVRNVPLLALDDLGVHSATPWAQEKLYQVFNHRYREELPTVVTLACPVESLDEHIAARIGDTRLSQVHLLSLPEPAPAFQKVGDLPEEMVARMTFDNFDVRGAPQTDPVGRQSLEAAFQFARNFARDPQGWVVFSGVHGAGKTHLAVAIAGERLKQGQPVYFVMVPDLLDRLRYTYSPDSPIPYDRLFDQVKNAPLLILDDLGAQVTTPWAHEKLYQIVAHRYNLQLPTVITTNITDINELPPAIASRLRDGALVELQPLAVADYRSREAGRYRPARGQGERGRGRSGGDRRR